MTPRIAAFASLALLATPAAADLAISVQDSKAMLENGVAKTNPKPDTRDHAVILDMSASPPKIVGRVDLPATVVGPPVAAAISRDESLALVTSAQKPDGADPSKTVADNRMSVIDLKANPPKVVATVEAGAGASGVSISRDGKLALVANRNEGTVSVFTIDGKTVTPAGKVNLGDAKSGPSHVVITPDGKRALVTRDGDHTLSILKIDGGKVEDAKRDFGVGYRPYGADISPDGKYVVVANVGRNVGDSETVNLVDLSMNPPRVVDTIGVGPTPEGITLSPDGKVAAVITHNGSAKAKDSPLYNAHGKLVLLRIDNGRLARFAEAPIGTWAQGSAFSRDGKTLLVQNNVERELAVFRIDGNSVTQTGRIPVEGAPVSMRVSY